ncbi:MAG: ComEC/Rec2 family competence protein [Tannerellaceae bacterium]|nr:ComEC/Rec2 family competence protein [Tannerellaceae bacterium]
MTAYHESRISYPLPIQEWARHTQLRLTASFNHLKLTEEERSVLATITLGDRSLMSKAVRQQFSITGVAHILSVSGFHVAIVCGFLLRMLSFLSGNNAGRWIRYLLTLLLLWTFTLITGLATASIRAAVMLTLHLTGRQLGRVTDRYNIFVASAFGMLVYNPFYLYDIGFQLSYVAVGFILYLQPRLSRLIQVRNPILRTPWEWITLTLAAQTGVTFLCLYYFGQFSTVFLFTNLPLTLIATLLIPVALLWILLPAGFPGSPVLQTLLETLTHRMMWIVDVFSHLPGNALSFRFDLATMLLCYGSLVFLLLYGHWKECKSFLFASLLLLLSVVARKVFYLFL